MGIKLRGEDHWRRTIQQIPPPLLLQYNELDICAAHLMRSRSEDQLFHRCFYRHNSIIHSIAEHKI